MINLDVYILNFINGLAYRREWIDAAGVFFAKYSEYILAAVFIFLLAVGFRKYWKMILVSLLAGAVSRLVIGWAIKALFFRPRPFLTENVKLLYVYGADESSFPSGHALFYFALSTAIFVYNKKLGIIFYLGTLAIVFSRIFVGIHWPSDILAGALIGILVGWIIAKFFKKYENRIFRKPAEKENKIEQ